MDNLTKAIQDTKINNLQHDSETRLEQAAIDWAGFCLKTFTGALLSRGLDISKSIAEFLNEYQRKES